MKYLLLTGILTAFLINSNAQNTPGTEIKLESTKPSTLSSNWADKVQIRGYMQVRYNRLFETNPNLGCSQCDRSWGNNGGLFLRRMRIIFFGQISKKVYFYVQPDFASSVTSDNLHFAQLRDAYFDLGLDNNNEYRLRIGQSKIPYGFENMQSSQNRLPLDRNDALNSAVLNERDMGVFFYWAPKSTRKLFSSLVRDGLKGSGDYGVFAFGFYNGQTANKPELNNNPHIVSRIAYPIKIKNQIIEPALQAYTGQWVLAKSSLSQNVKVNANATYLDQRVAASFVVYPQPFGIMAEYNIGKGPEFNKHTDSIETRDLKGGYVTLNYRIVAFDQQIFPFVRLQHYSGGKKFETDARSYSVNEYEFGVEWQPNNSFELVVMYTHSLRRYEDFVRQNNFQQGNLLRIQAQMNF
jgi:hypothetical protein